MDIKKQTQQEKQNLIIASELRIGNFIEKSGDKCVLASINTDNTIRIFNNDKTYTLGCFLLRMFKPIPLTEEWLIKFGFEETKEEDYVKWFTKEKLDIVIGEDNFIVFDHLVLKHIKHVHQFQNLYFSLIGFELNVV